MAPASTPALGSVKMAAVTGGLRHLRQQRVVQGAMAADVVAMIFGMPRALFPILAVTQFDRGPEVVGLLFAARPSGRSSERCPEAGSAAATAKGSRSCGP